MMKYVLYALLIWFAYQFIFKLVIPVYKTSKKIKQGFREMQEKMSAQQEQFSQQQTNTRGKTAEPSASKTPAGDYIDFEELK